jgi:hypothetical protein
MKPRHRRSSSQALWSILNRVAQCNVAIAICIAAMIRCSMDFSSPVNDRPDPLFVFGFFIAMAVAIYATIQLRRAVHAFPNKWQQVTTAFLSFAAQFAVLELLILFVVE